MGKSTGIREERRGWCGLEKWKRKTEEERILFF